VHNFVTVQKGISTSSIEIVAFFNFQLLNALQKFGTNLDEFLHLLLPPIVKLLDAPDVPLSLKRVALDTIDQLSCTLNFSDFASRYRKLIFLTQVIQLRQVLIFNSSICRIIHPLVRILDNVPELRENCMDTLCSLVIQFGPKFQVFIPMIQRTITNHNIKNDRYEKLILRKCKDDYFSESEDSEVNQQSRMKQRTYSRSRQTGLTDTDTYSINRVTTSLKY